jgi:hypothetical protein
LAIISVEEFEKRKEAHEIQIKVDWHQSLLVLTETQGVNLMIVDTITNDLFFRIFPFFSHHGPVSTFLFCAVPVPEKSSWK